MIPNLPDRTHAMVMSYIGIRRAVGMSGLLLPIVLGPVGWLCGIEFQDNMSSYYHTGLRDVFVGTMCAMAVFLFCYRGHDRIEHWSANLVCASALGIALFPLDPNSDPLYQKSVVGYLHSLSGAVFFLTLSFYSLYHFPRSAGDDGEAQKHLFERNLVYRTSGIVILLTLGAMGTYMLTPADTKSWLNDYNVLFWLEWIAVWAFAAAWLTKGRTIVAEIAVDLLAIPTSAIAERLGVKHDGEGENE